MTPDMVLEQKMDREINLGPILALEKQIEEHEGYGETIIQLKRTRNSLLNVSILLPPEILGSVFCWNVIPDGDFGGVPGGSYNFLLVCHHWFDVASCTPELWSFWGNSIHDWTHRHTRCATAPVDLALEISFTNDRLDDQLRDALQDHAARDTIRRIHLRSIDANLLNPIISSMVTQGEETQAKRVESFIIEDNKLWSPVDVSAFFSRYHLPKLRCLRLVGCRISSWDLLRSQTTVLTTLQLTSDDSSSRPTLSQMLSILSSNPLLQHVRLSFSLDPRVVDGDTPPSKVRLRHLKHLYLASDPRYTFQLLSLLELPDKMDNLDLFLDKSSPSGLSQMLGPYIGDHVQRRGRFPGGGLGLLVKHRSNTFTLSAGDTRIGGDPAKVVWFLKVSATTDTQLEGKEADWLCFDLIAHIRREQVTRLETNLPILRWEELCVAMRNLTHLHLTDVNLSTWFAELAVCGPQASKELLRGLTHIVITRATLRGGDWSPLTNFLSRRAAVGNRISSLRLTGHPYMEEGVVESIKRVVEVFEDKSRGRAVTASG